MKKIAFSAIAAATLFASIGAASAQSENFWTAHQPSNVGGASVGYNQTIASPDAVK